MTTRILVRGEHDPVGRHQAALACVMEFYRATPRDVVLLAPSQERLLHGPFGNILGHEPTQAVLDAPQPFAGHVMHAATADDADPSAWNDAIVVVTEANPELVDLAEQAADAALIIVVPSRIKELDAWVEAYQPVQIGPADQTGAT